MPDMQPKTILTLTVPDAGEDAKRMTAEGAVAAGEIVSVRIEGLPETRLTLEEANAGLTLRLVAPDAVPPAFGLDRRGPVVIAQTEPGSWMRDTDGRLVAPLNLATVQALALLPPFPPPAPAVPAVRRFPPPPPPPSPYELTAFGARMATALLEYRDSDTAQTLFGAAPMTLLPWPPDGRTADLLDLATGRVYSKAEVDALLAEKATVTALETVRTTANAANSAASVADGKAQTALNGLAGKADLVGGKVPSSQLPSYVDDVLEFASRSAFPATGEAGKIYVALDTNKTYRWSGSEYVEISNPDLSGYATKADATLNENEFTAWVFADGLHEAARENMRDSQDGPITVPTHLELRVEATGTACLIVGDGVFADFCSVSISSDGKTATMTSGIPWSTEIVPVGSALATRNAVTNYRLGPEYGPNADKPLAPAGNYALKSELPAVPVKAVKRNGTALTPDAQGAVNVEVPMVVAPSTAAADSGKAADAKATGEALAGKMAATADGNTILTGGTEWGGAPIGVFADQITKLLGDMFRAEYVAAEYDATQTYHAGDHCTFTSALYKCKRTTTGDWAPGDWDIATVDGLLDEKQDTISDLAAIRSGAAAGATAVQPSGLANYVQKSQTAGLLKNDGTVDTNTYLTQHQDISGKLDAAKRNLLDYTTGTTLSPSTAVYRAALNADGTFPTITDTGIPTAAAYFQFELELSVPSTVPSTITGPSGWTWIDGHGLPDPADLSGGETICISVRLDCTARTFLASVWRVA